jgi:hypothetical protein
VALFTCVLVLDLFRELEDLQSQREIVPNDGDGFSVTSFGVSINSLEELLMKIGKERVFSYFKFCFTTIRVFLPKLMIIVCLIISDILWEICCTFFRDYFETSIVENSLKII